MPHETSDRAPSHSALHSLWDAAGMLVVFALLFGGCAVWVDDFLSWANMKGLALSVSTIGMVACTMLFCLASGDFDLSVGSVVACSGVLAAVVIDRTGKVALGVLAGVAAGGIVGLFNGVIIAKCKINALITTLATMQIVRIHRSYCTSSTPLRAQQCVGCSPHAHG